MGPVARLLYSTDVPVWLCPLPFVLSFVCAFSTLSSLASAPFSLPGQSRLAPHSFLCSLVFVPPSFPALSCHLCLLIMLPSVPSWHAALLHCPLCFMLPGSYIWFRFDMACSSLLPGILVLIHDCTSWGCISGLSNIRCC